MNVKGIEGKLEKEKHQKLLEEIEYNSKEYIKTYKMEKSGISYHFFEVENGEILDIKDEEILKYLETFYNINEDIIY